MNNKSKFPLDKHTLTLDLEGGPIEYNGGEEYLIPSPYLIDSWDLVYHHYILGFIIISLFLMNK